MPKDYLEMRDKCYERKRKDSGELTEKDKQECKKWSAIYYYKKHGKPVQHSDAEELQLDDAIEMEILLEQVEIFGNLEEYNKWAKEGE